MQNNGENEAFRFSDPLPSVYASVIDFRVLSMTFFRPARLLCARHRCAFRFNTTVLTASEIIHIKQWQLSCKAAELVITYCIIPQHQSL
jgi:hypothetical protein